MSVLFQINSDGLFLHTSIESIISTPATSYKNTFSIPEGFILYFTETLKGMYWHDIITKDEICTPVLAIFLSVFSHQKSKIISL